MRKGNWSFRSILGIPLVYDFDEHMKPIRHYYMKDDETVSKAVKAVINETNLDPQACIYSSLPTK